MKDAAVETAAPPPVVHKRENRRHDRYPASLTVALITGKLTQPATVVDVSFSGLGLTVLKPPQLRNLVRLRLELPSDKQPIELLGMAVYVGQKGSAAAPAVGVQLFGIDEATRERWERYVNTVRRSHGASPIPHSAPAPAAPPKALVPEIRLHAPTVSMLHDALLGNADGTVNIRSPVALARGAKLQVVVVHPESGRHLRLPANVLSADGQRLRFLLVQRDRHREELTQFLEDREHVTLDIDITIDEAAGAARGH